MDKRLSSLFNSFSQIKKSFEVLHNPFAALDFHDIISELYGWKEINFLEQFKYVFDGIVKE